MPSTLTELMLRSPDSNNLANASLWEGHRMGGEQQGAPLQQGRQRPQPRGWGASFMGRKSRAELCP